jgi:UDP-N-acetylglucosamine 2-epimerase
MRKLKVMTIVGTRPEIIKLSRVIAELDRHTEHLLVHTGQNYDYELNEIFFQEMGIRRPDYFLEAARPTPAETIGQVIATADAVLQRTEPDAVLFYGDTNSCLAAISAKRRKIPIFHMEAGNRCFDQRVPEEINRKIIDHISDINMPLTEHGRRYLLDEGLRPETVIKIGSTMFEVLAHYRSQIESSEILARLRLEPGGYFVASAHREENVDCQARLGKLLEALNAVAARYRRPIVVSLHPRTRARIEARGAGPDLDPLIRFSKPLGFFDYVALEKNAFCVLSDSGTLTEESSLLEFPAVMLREAHERPEGMDAGTLVMSGLESERILQAIEMVTSQQSGAVCLCAAVPDYVAESVSKKVVRIILSYVDYVNRTVWSKPALRDAQRADLGETALAGCLMPRDENEVARSSSHCL